MDKRFFLALALSVVVIVLTQRLFPTPASKAGSIKQPVDTARFDSGTPSGLKKPHMDSAGDKISSLNLGSEIGQEHPASHSVDDSVTVNTTTVRYQFSSRGAVPTSVVLKEYRSLSQKGRSVQLERPGQRLVRFLVVDTADTLNLDQVLFQIDTVPGTGQGRAPLTFRGVIGSWTVVLTYLFSPDSYLVHVQGNIRSLGDSRIGQLQIVLPGGLRSEEADTLDDQRHLAYVAKATRSAARSIAFTKLEPHETVVEEGPLTWIASKNKYFLLAVLSPSPSSDPGFASVAFIGRVHPGKIPTNADAVITQAVQRDGRIGFDLYAGPQAWRRLTAIGKELEHVNPYGGFLRAVVEPFASFVMWAVLGLHDKLRVGYGWVLVVFGIVVRLILWPLNQRAMRSNLKMQRIQPELQELQKKYAKQPEKQHAEMMRVYKEHGMSPFSMFSGCLPMLLPMPVLFALFFVFQNTIEFRGVSFLWLHDISQKDPYYILPALMGVSMFFLSWIGMRNTPPNPQAKTMTYVFPVMMTAFFLNLASGLNLYYAVQNIAALPQQWLIARERSRTSSSVRS